MPNTLTNLIDTLFAGLDVVSREQVGCISAVSRNSTAERAAVNQTVNIFTAPAIVGGNVTPGSIPPDDGDATFGNVTMTIQKSRYWPIRWNGEEQLSVKPSGMGPNVLQDQFSQAFRAACNEIEADLAALHIYSSRAYGTAGTAPFGTSGDLSDIAQVRKILEDNGAPMTDLQLVLGTSAKANLGGKQSLLFKVNEAGTADLLRRGIVGQLEGFDIHASAQIKTSVAGTAASATTNNAGYAVGATTLTLASAGTGTLVAGDVVTFAGDTNQYLVVSGDTDVSNGGTLVIAEPGLRVAMSAATKAITVVAAAARNMAFSKSAIQLATRLPALPIGLNGKAGDSASDRVTLSDPISGLMFDVAVYEQYHQIKFEVSIAWGVKMITPRHAVVLLG